MRLVIEEIIITYPHHPNSIRLTRFSNRGDNAPNQAQFTNMVPANCENHGHYPSPAVAESDSDEQDISEFNAAYSPSNVESKGALMTRYTTTENNNN